MPSNCKETNSLKKSLWLFTFVLSTLSVTLRYLCNLAFHLVLIHLFNSDTKSFCPPLGHLMVVGELKILIQNEALQMLLFHAVFASAAAATSASLSSACWVMSGSEKWIYPVPPKRYITLLMLVWKHRRYYYFRI